MSFVIAAITYDVAKPVVNTLTGKTQRDAAKAQQAALLSAQQADARQKAESETGAAVSANAALAASKRRRKASSLLTSPSATTLGGAGSLLGAGGLNQGPP